MFTLRCTLLRANRYSLSPLLSPYKRHGKLMSSYWSKFPDFNHNEAAPVKAEFKRLAWQQGWIKSKRKRKEEYKSDTYRKKKEEKERDIYREQWAECLESELTKQYGDSSLLEGWQKLCREVGIEDIPQSIKACRKVLKTEVWVNIEELVDRRRTGKPFKLHESEEALRAYTKATKKFFPLEEAKEDGFLAALLIHMIVPE
ncbi:hypothetical protein M408DRAFT_333718 [Serendipita vermifera MAFF 305830]|uniref:Uncharacterized protein n=1 Tax=Serendipita vermifera MAFF 305830 TaxID=933852 RepID=A0A0C3AP21_SERVB|nr:hypothetical protein M408DRAFT_333718 [Serendipita vermifera MAFF 305830]